jgi:hypothetical protein
MTDTQIWQTIALNLKRAANYRAAGSLNKAEYYLSEAKSLYKTQKLTGKIKKIQSYIKFEGNPEDILLSSSLIFTRI